jgi:preprotein translocase subunit SecE
VARDRQRAKQRKARRAAQANAPAPSQPRRADLPGELEHASGEVDEFEAALVSGAGGEPRVSDDADLGDVRVDEEGDLEELSDEDFAELEDEVDEYEARGEGRLPADEAEDGELEREALSSAPPPGGGPPSATAAADRPAGRPAPTPHAPVTRGPARFFAFLRACWAELQRVQWPDRRQVAQATGVVIGFVIVAGLYLGLADYVAKKVVNVII